MTRDEIERQLHGFRRIEPPIELRARVRRAAVPVVVSVTWSDRIWFSRAWRIAAVTAAAGAIAIESFSGVTESTRVASPHGAAEAQAIDDAGREIGLPASFTSALAQRAVALQARAASATPEPLLDDLMPAKGERR